MLEKTKLQYLNRYHCYLVSYPICFLPCLLSIFSPKLVEEQFKGDLASALLQSRLEAEQKHQVLVYEAIFGSQNIMTTGFIRSLNVDMNCNHKTIFITFHHFSCVLCNLVQIKCAVFMLLSYEFSPHHHVTCTFSCWRVMMVSVIKCVQCRRKNTAPILSY